MMPLALIGMLFGGGLFGVVRGLRPRHVALATVVRRIEAGGAPDDQLADSVRKWLVGRSSTRTDRDLAVVGREPARHAAEKISTTLGLAVVAAVFGRMFSSFPSVALGLGFAGGAFGFVLPDLLLRSHAAKRRRAFRHALSSFLDLVNVMLAGGAGVETSLEAAASAGDGWVFDHINEALLRARATRRSPWAAFSELAERLDIPELAELSSSVQLAGEQGARIRSSLSAKAQALRARQLAQIEADAQSASERMGVPMVLMFVGFLLLLGYPALQSIAGL